MLKLGSEVAGRQCGETKPYPAPRSAGAATIQNNDNKKYSNNSIKHRIIIDIC